MNRNQLTDDLLSAPLRVYEAEGNLHAAKLAVTAAKDALAGAEADLLLGLDADGAPLLWGKNAEQRAAAMLRDTEREREAVRYCERSLLAFERDYNLAVNHARALRSVAALLAGAEDA